MTDVDPDRSTGVLADLPETVRGGRLVGVDGTGVPIYFDEGDGRAFEALQTDGEWVVGEERTDATVADVVDEVARVTGWTALSAFGDAATDN